MTAAVAEGDDHQTAKLWFELSPGDRAAVLAALGAQARFTAHAAGNADALIAAQAVDLAADLRNCKLRHAAMMALAGQPCAEVPWCDGCPRGAVALARARLRVLAALGFSYPHMAELCRRAARP